MNKILSTILILAATLIAGAELPPEVRSLKLKRDQKLDDVNQIYVRQLQKLRDKYSKRGELDRALATAKEIESVDPNQKAPSMESAEIFAVCDDYAEIALNGQVIAKCKGGAVARVKLVDLKEGDIIAVRVINHRGLHGFASVIKLPSGGAIATSTSTWKTFKPTKGLVWFDPEGIKSVKRAKGGTQQEWKGKIESETGIACDSIWGEGNSTYVMLEVPRLH